MPHQPAVRYDIEFHPDAYEEYKRPDHSVAAIVDKELADLEERAGVRSGRILDSFAESIQGW